MSAVRTLALVLLPLLFCQVVTAQLRAGDYEITNMDGTPVLDGAVAGKTNSPDGTGDMVGNPYRRGTTGVLIRDEDTGGWISIVLSGPSSGRMTRFTLL